jgi:hypothetical protein
VKRRNFYGPKPPPEPEWPNITTLRCPLPWGCLPTAYAMATGIPFYEWINAIGHDGSEVIFDYLPDPQRRRGFHYQELYRAALTFGIATTEIQLNPVTTTDGKNRYPLVFKEGNVLSFTETLKGRRAVIGGVNSEGVGHAVAFDGDLWLAYDPVKPEPATLWDGSLDPKIAFLLHRLPLTKRA